MDSNKFLDLIKRRWVPAFLVPLCVIAFVVILITAIGELLLYLYRMDTDYGAVGGALFILVFITVVAIFFGVQATRSGGA